MSFDKIFDLTAGVYFIFYKTWIDRQKVLVPSAVSRSLPEVPPHHHYYFFCLIPSRIFPLSFSLPSSLDVTQIRGR